MRRNFYELAYTIQSTLQVKRNLCRVERINFFWENFDNLNELYWNLITIMIIY